METLTTETPTEPTDERLQTERDEEGRFHIVSESGANWFLRTIRGIERQQANLDTELETEIAFLIAQRTRRGAQLTADATYLHNRYDCELEAWGRARIAQEKGRRKTVHLLQGSISVKTVPALVSVDNLQDAITTARAVCPEAFTTETVTKENFDKVALLTKAKALLAEEGKRLPGVSYRDADEKFDYKFPDAPTAEVVTEETPA